MVMDQAAKSRIYSNPHSQFFGNLMSSKELFDKTDYTPFLCGEESFGTSIENCVL
jgi:hypothetical protein